MRCQSPPSGVNEDDRDQAQLEENLPFLACSAPHQVSSAQYNCIYCDDDVELGKMNSASQQSTDPPAASSSNLARTATPTSTCSSCGPNIVCSRRYGLALGA
jgi:hypothetical protein